MSEFLPIVDDGGFEELQSGDTLSVPLIDVTGGSIVGVEGVGPQGGVFEATYIWSTDTGSPPNTGGVTCDNATPHVATVIRVNDVDRLGLDGIGGLLMYGNSFKGYIRVIDSFDATKWVTGRIDSITRGTDTTIFHITLFDFADDSFTNGSRVTVSVAPNFANSYGGPFVVSGGILMMDNADYGDITVSGNGTVFTVDNDVVTYAKMQNVSATDKLLGRSSSGAGDVEEITCTATGRSLIDDTSTSAMRTTLGLGTVSTLDSDTDGSLSANSDSKIATQKAVKTYVDNAVTGLLDFKGSTDCSGNPNYPAALKGDSYIVSVAGKIGGASGKSVDVGDAYFATADNAGGTDASVGSSWDILEHNLVGALLSANNLSDVASASTARTNLGLGTSATHAAGDFLLAANNLSDVASASTARTNLGLGTMATQSASSVAITGGTIVDTGGAHPKGAVNVDYTFSTTTTSGPATGMIRINNATDSSATIVYVHNTDRNSISWQNVFGNLIAYNGLLRLVHATDSTKWILFYVTSNVDSSGYFTMTSSWVAHSGANPFSNGDKIVLSWEAVLPQTVIPKSPQIDVYTSGTPTWNKPTGAITVHSHCVGGGGGGGSGRVGATSFTRGAGGGGGGGEYSYGTFSASSLSSMETVTVGAGGAAGSRTTSDDHDGNDGTAGGTSSFGTHVTANGGGAGLKGTNSDGGTGGAGGSGGTGSVEAGGAGGHGGGNTSPTAGASTTGLCAGAGGGGGAGVLSNNTRDSAGAGGTSGGKSGVGGAGITTSVGSLSGFLSINGDGGGDGLVVVNASVVAYLGGGGGGGAGATPATGANAFASGNGGHAGRFGGGGGGGAGGSNSSLISYGDRGGNGGSGVVVVITYFDSSEVGDGVGA